MKMLFLKKIKGIKKIFVKEKFIQELKFSANVELKINQDLSLL